MKVVNEWTYLAAYYATQPMMSVCTTDLDVDNVENCDEVILPDESDSPEKTLIQKELFENLSEEAKYLINLIYEAPAEFLAVVCSKEYKKISGKGVKRFLKRKLKWSSKKIEKVFAEIKTYIKEKNYV